MTKQLFIVVFTAMSLMACKNETKKEQVGEPAEKVEVETKNISAQNNYQVGSQVPNELVCMVNNAYMGKLQIPVPVNGKTYYGCCEMCVGTLNNSEKARIGIDPFSKKPVDKTEAYIVLMKKEGNVAYFESKENYLSYKKAM